MTKYLHGWDSPSQTVNLAVAGSPSPAIMLMPPPYGLTVASVDGTNHTSPTRDFYILVTAPSNALAQRPLDIEGTTPPTRSPGRR